MASDELFFLSAQELAAAVRDKSLSPVEITEAVLDRIELLNPKLNAFCTSMADSARKAAQAAEQAVMRGEQLGPFHGVPISVKDNLYVKDVRTTFGSQLMRDAVSDVDAPMVQRLRAAGAIIIGRTNTPEFGWKGVTDNLLFGATRNPWNLDLTPGGSSGGASAAVASGMGPIGLGTDGGGSLRIPASFCGLVGHKPSFGRVPHYPGISIGSLRHVGGITRTVCDSARLLDVIAGPDERDACSLPATVSFCKELDHGIDGVRIAYSRDLGFAQVAPEVARICEASAQKFEQAGAKVERIDLDWADPYEWWKVFFYGGATARLRDCMAEQGHLLDPGLRTAVTEGMKLTVAEYTQALNGRNDFWLKVCEVFANYDLLISPTLAVLPFPIGQDNADPFPGQELGDLQWTAFTYPFNLTGQPVSSVPAGWTHSNLPVGMQIIGRRFDDALVLRAARAWEQIQPWADRRPPICEA